MMSQQNLHLSSKQADQQKIHTVEFLPRENASDVYEYTLSKAYSSEGSSD